MKTCSHCKEVLPLDRFIRYRDRGKDHLRAQCKACKSAQQAVAYSCANEDCTGRTCKRGSRCLACHKAWKASPQSKRPRLVVERPAKASVPGTCTGCGAATTARQRKLCDACYEQHRRKKQTSAQHEKRWRKEKWFEHPYTCANQSCKRKIIAAGLCYVCATGRARVLIRPDERAEEQAA